MVYSLLVFHWRPVTVYFYLKGIVSTTLTPVVTASLTLPLRGTREPLLNRVLIIIMSNKNRSMVTFHECKLELSQLWILTRYKSCLRIRLEYKVSKWGTLPIYSPWITGNSCFVVYFVVRRRSYSRRFKSYYRSLPLLVKVYDFDLPPKEGQR